MKGILLTALLAGVAAALPGFVCAQPPGSHPGGGGGGHPAPAMHAPAPAMHAPASHFQPVARRPMVHNYTHRPVVHNYAHQPVSHYHHPIAHHHVTIHTAHVVHHIHPVVHARSHLNPRVVGLRHNVRAAHRFHAGIYRAPPGYRYRRWSYGGFLPSVYWGRDYWLTDFLAFGLFAPPDGYIWVRYGPDALLIDQYTGEILQVDYGVFY